VDVDPAPAQPQGAVLRLLPPVPNPFREQTQLRFELGRAATVEAELHDVQGRRLKSWPRRRLDPGQWGFDWDGCTDRGRRVAAGVYFYRLIANGAELATGRVALAR
jgi:hypothetical protein